MLHSCALQCRSRCDALKWWGGRVTGVKKKKTLGSLFWIKHLRCRFLLFPRGSNRYCRVTSGLSTKTLLSVSLLQGAGCHGNKAHRVLPDLKLHWDCILDQGPKTCLIIFLQLGFMIGKAFLSSAYYKTGNSGLELKQLNRWGPFKVI